MKRILIALFTVFACCKTFAEPSGGFIPQLPPIYTHPEVVEYAIEKYVVAPYDPNAVKAAYEKYMNQDDGTITMENLQQKVCPAGGMDYARCKEFTNALMIPYYDVCDSGKGKSGGNEHCEKNFFYYAAPKNLSFGNGTYVRTKEAIGLAQEYALVKDKQKVVCVSTKGNSKKTDTIWCTGIDKKHFYEFKFNNIKETKDDYIKQSLLSAICKLHNTTYTTSATGATTSIGGTAPGYSWPDSCETADKLICANINKSLGRFSYKATIGTSDVPPIGKHSTCVIEKVVNDISNLRTAYGIDPTVFKTVQALAGEDIDKKIKQYVKQELQKQKITFDEKSFHCADSTNVLNGGDVLTCYVNNKPIDFLFKDLSEWNGVNKRGGAQAMDCIVSGGTYTGKRCTNLNQKQCEMLRSANLKSCPSCNMVRWDAKNKVCTLPSSAAATNLQKDMKVVAIVGGAVVGAAITIATAGTAGLTLGGYIILGVETTGAGIELWSQSKIDGIADEFLLKSTNCKTKSCAQSLIKDNFQYLADSQNDFSDTEISAIDTEMARLASMIPDDSDFWTDIALNSLSMIDNKSGVLDFEHWTPEQIWRTVGITLQLASVVTSVGKWVATKTANTVTKLSKSTNVLKSKTQKAVDVIEYASDQRVLTAKQLQLQQRLNLIDPDTLNDVDRAYYDLWKKYAPRNQSFKSFKEMGTLQEIRDMSKSWVAWDDIEQFNVIQAKIDKFFSNHPGAFDEIATADDLAALESKYPELFELYRQQDKLGDLNNLRLHTKGNYSTYDPTLNSKKIVYDNETTQAKLDKALKEYLHDSDINANKRYQQKITDTQIEYFSSKLSQDAVDEIAALRVEQFDDIINKSPRLQDLRTRWYSLSNSEKLDFAQELSDQLLLRNGVAYNDLPKVENVYLTPQTYGNFRSSGINPNDIINSTVQIDLDQIDSFSDFANTLAHEVGGHGVNTLNPNAGIGSQMRYISGGLSGSDYDAYRLEPEEIIAWRTGNAVGATYKPTNPIEIGDVLAKPITGQGAHVIDASSHSQIVYERTKQGVSKLTEDLYNNKVVLMFDYSEDIRENFSDINNMLRRSGLRIFRTNSGYYAITTEQVMKSMM